MNRLTASIGLVLVGSALALYSCVEERDDEQHRNGGRFGPVNSSGGGWHDYSGWHSSGGGYGGGKTGGFSTRAARPGAGSAAGPRRRLLMQRPARRAPAELAADRRVAGDALPYGRRRALLGRERLLRVHRGGDRRAGGGHVRPGQDVPGRRRST